jgi:hypothetical protein
MTVICPEVREVTGQVNLPQPAACSQVSETKILSQIFRLLFDKICPDLSSDHFSKINHEKAKIFFFNI